MPIEAAETIEPTITRVHFCMAQHWANAYWGIQMATLVVIENRPGRVARLAKEYFPSDDEALDRAFDLMHEEGHRPRDRVSANLTLRIECDDDRTVMNDAMVRRLAVLERS